MSDDQGIEASVLIEVYQAELAEAMRVNVMLKAMIAQKNQELAKYREVENNG